MRLLLLLCLLFVGKAVYAQPPESDNTYLKPYAHPQKSSFSLLIKTGFTAMNTAAPLLNDLKGQNLFLKPQISLGVGYQFTNYIGLLLRATYYRHSYNAIGSFQNFEGVKSNNFEGVLQLKHYVFPLQHFDEYLRRFNYYGLVGAGVLYHNPYEKGSGDQLSETIGFNNYVLVIPVGVGIEYRLSNFFLMALELDYHITRTEYLDGLKPRDGSLHYDKFGSWGVNITYRIPRKDFKYKQLLKLKNKAY